ncbi:Vps45p [Nakaseomyces bracarensis]|uniref:Vps45p n=1 Tax=Nakaseomyces bracarensis TaxID=273131 RepID=UPI003871CA31
MNLFDVAHVYIDRILNSKSKAGVGEVNERSRIKALLLDKDTKSTISMCSTQSELLHNEIFLIDTIENQQRDIERHLRCLVYINPTDESIDYLVKELRNPKYGDYHLFFSNIVSKAQLERLAEADDMEAVSKVEEIFQDYYILNEDLFSFDMFPGQLTINNSGVWDEYNLATCKASLLSVLLSLKIKPDIRYESNSKMCAKLANEIASSIGKNEKALFDFPAMDVPPLLILLDRKNDPLTPLLQPWTYQSMINEYIGLRRNVVDLSNIPDIDKDLEHVTLSSMQDKFFYETMYMNFGELGDKVKNYVDTYKMKSQSNSKINTIEDIKNFIEKYPEFRKLSGNVSKHMTIVGELDKQLKSHKIWEISEIEQNISVHKDNSEDFQSLIVLLREPSIDKYYKVKLVCIYITRHYDIQDKINTLIREMSNIIDPQEVNFLHRFHKLITQVHQSSSTTSMSESEGKKDDLLSELAKKFNTKMASRGILNTSQNKAENNVYMQHIPEISTMLAHLSKTGLPNDKYTSLKTNSGYSNNSKAAKDVVIFVVGGVTYEEARLVHQFNGTMKDKIRVVLGGTSILSTRDYIEAMLTKSA